MLPQKYSFIYSKDSGVREKIRISILDKKLKTEIISIFDKNLVFIYPKIISFSFIQYSEDQGDYFSYKTEDRLSSSYDHQLQTNPFVYTPETYIDFFSLLFPILSIEFSNLLFIIDLRKHDEIDINLVKTLLELSVKNKITMSILSSYKQNIEISNSINSSLYLLLEDYNDFFAHINSLLSQDKNKLNLVPLGKLNIITLEQLLEANSFYELALSSLCFVIDLNNITDLSSFGLFYLMLFIEKICWDYGLLCIIKCDNLSRRVFNSLRSYSFCKIKEPYIIFNAPVDTGEKDTFRSFNIRKFGGRSLTKLMDNTSYFFGYIVNMFPDYFNEYIGIPYEFKEDGKVRTMRLVRKNVILQFISELVANIQFHSEGNGYIFIELNRYILSIIVGDSGIGIRRGIIKNYNLEEKLINDHNAINLAFNLFPYHHLRSKYAEGAGCGLRDTLNYIFRCNGKFIMRTNKTVGSFVNPVVRATYPSKILDFYFNANGTQYLVNLPLTDISRNYMPKSTKDFLEW